MEYSIKLHFKIRQETPKPAKALKVSSNFRDTHAIWILIQFPIKIELHTNSELIQGIYFIYSH